MSIPVKIQHNDMSDDWKSIFILVDGSLYGVTISEFPEVVPLSRSYTGQVIKDTMKTAMTTHHFFLRQAALARRSKNFVDADNFRSVAEYHLREYKELEKMWNVFRSFSPKVARKKERAEKFKDSKVKHKMSCPKKYQKCRVLELDGVPLHRVCNRH